MLRGYIMKLSECNIGFAITGSFCTFDKIIPYIDLLNEKSKSVTQIYSYNASSFDTRFTSAQAFVDNVSKITGKPGIDTIQKAEPIGPKKLFDVLVIAPCTGNTIAKLANGITDTPVLMAAKAHLRNNRPLVIAISTNDALGINLQNIGKLMIMKNIYLVPFKQDDYVKKPNSLVADFNQLEASLLAALEGKQLQPIIAY